MLLVHMMLPVVWALITTFSNAEGCSVCGDGFHVGNPDGLVKVSVPGNKSAPVANAATPIPCDELELAGLNGNIPNGQCAILPPLIFDVCDCQLSRAVTESDLVLLSTSPDQTMGVTTTLLTVSTKPSFLTSMTAAPTRVAKSIGSPVATNVNTAFAPTCKEGPAVKGRTLLQTPVARPPAVAIVRSLEGPVVTAATAPSILTPAAAPVFPSFGGRVIGVSVAPSIRAPSATPVITSFGVPVIDESAVPSARAPAVATVVPSFGGPVVSASVDAAVRAPAATSVVPPLGGPIVGGAPALNRTMPAAAPFIWRPISAPIIYQSPLAGILPSDSVPNADITSAPSMPAEQSFSVVVIVMVCVPLGLVLVLVCVECFCTPCTVDCNPLLSWQRRNVRPAAETSTETSAATAAQAQYYTVASKRRLEVLEVLFPMQRKCDSDQPSSARSLKYDQRSKRYMYSDDALDVKRCSICLEDLDESHDDSVSGLCTHTYHHQCIMDWLKQDHDDCPNCRQPMWEKETYDLVEASIKNRVPANGMLREWDHY